MLKEIPIRRTKQVKHEINTMEKMTIKQQPCRKAYGTQPIIREEFERMLAQDIIILPLALVFYQ